MGEVLLPDQVDLTLQGEAQTQALAHTLAALAKPGLVILLNGPVGAGKSTLARATIQTLLAAHGLSEDIPSPTFTLVQSYAAAELEIWHADLYRLSDVSELAELGLDEAFQTAFCLIEWPDRLGEETPSAIEITLAHLDDPDARGCQISANSESLADVLGQIAEALK